MGNKNLSTKYVILKILREANAPVSGEEAAKLADISRVSVWKAIQSLQASGYGISSTRAGYFLEKDLKDSLFPWEFGAEEELFFHFPETESTMTEARKIAQENSFSKKMEIITADKQTKGQGHSSHKWTTTKGSLACTLITRSGIAVSYSHRATMAAQIAIVKTLTEMTGRKFYARWPNDIWSENGKVGGILDEISATGEKCNWLNIGIGINLTSCPKIPNTDCAVKSDAKFSRKEFLSAFLKEFKSAEEKLQQEDSSLVCEWNNLCFDNGKKIRLESDKNIYTFKGINAFGFALLESKNQNRILIPGQDSFIKNR